MPARRVLEPTEEPLSLADAKAFLKVEHDAEDILIGSLIRAGREYAEQFTERALAGQEWEEATDRFPCGAGGIVLSRPPLREVVSLTYIDAAGAAVVLAPAAYLVDAVGLPPRVAPVGAAGWPACSRRAGAVRIRYRCGYAARPAEGDPPLAEGLEPLPETILTAIKVYVHHFFYDRGAKEPPSLVDVLLRPYVVPWIA